jgi:two-component system, NarL family, response regulator DevR
VVSLWCRAVWRVPGRGTPAGVAVVVGGEHPGEVSAPVRVFLVSHAIAVRAAVADMLDRDARFDVVGQATTGVQAMVRVPAARPDLLVATRVLPDTTGVQLIADILGLRLPMQAVLFSIWVDDELLRDALAAGAVGVQCYDFLDEEGLAEVLVRAARGQAVLPADAMRRLMTGAAEPDADPLGELTDTERTIVELVGEGYTNREIAAAMHLADGTTRNYVSRLMHKLGVRRRTQVVALASLRRPTPRSDESMITLPAARAGADRRA